MGGEAVAAAMATFDGDWDEVARDLLRRRLGAAHPQDPTWRRKAADLLLRRGFRMQHLHAATAESSD